MRRAATIALLAGSMLALGAPTASAAPADIRTGPLVLNLFTASSYDHEGGTVANLTWDGGLAGHNVISSQTGPDGGVLFASATITSGTTPVNNTQYLPAGDYPFFCDIHPTTMTSSLHVTGTPLPRPGATFSPFSGAQTARPPDSNYAANRRKRCKRGKKLRRGKCVKRKRKRRR